jgi:dipeptidyl aminopeptidase/acylaminoacyl peptidase
MRPGDLNRLNALSIPTVHPIGDRAVFAATRPDFDADAYVGQLWMIRFDGLPARRITRGFCDASPAFSPDGRLVGFLRAAPGRPPQVAVMAADGGEPMIITDQRLGVSQFRFSPDSRRIAFIAAVAEDGRYGSVSGVDSGHEDPRLIEQLQFQLDGVGYLADQRRQVFVVDVPDPGSEPPVVPVGRAARDGRTVALVPAATQLSAGDVSHDGLAWAGGSIITAVSRHETRDRDLRCDLFAYTPGLDEPRRLTDSANGPSVLGSPVVVGDQVYFVGIDLGPRGLDVAGVNAAVCVVPIAGGQARMLTNPAQVCIEGQLAADGDGVLALDQVRGNCQVIKVTDAGETQRWALPGSAHSVAVGAAKRIVVLATPTSPGELISLDSPHQPLTDFGAGLAAEVIVPQEQLATAADGTLVHGWLLRPAGEGPHPVVLMIHGGPFAAYSANFFDEAQMLAAAGIAVVMCNPRGSAGYGFDHGRAVKGALGDVDMVDVLAFLDHCLAADLSLDSTRVGVMGGSYGGFLAAWLIANTQRFTAAIVERGYLDGRSMIGAADIGWYFPFEYQGSLAEIDQRSPLYQVHRVQTPTMLIHSENDLRCPLSVAERYYTELKLRGVEAQLLVFPGEGHELSRSGTPHHRLARFQHILNWWSQHFSS